MLLLDGEYGIRNAHIIARAVYMECLHAVFQQQKHCGASAIHEQEFQLVCAAREQSLCERKPRLHKILLYAKCGIDSRIHPGTGRQGGANRNLAFIPGGRLATGHGWDRQTA